MGPLSANITTNGYSQSSTAHSMGYAPEREKTLSKKQTSSSGTSDIASSNAFQDDMDSLNTALWYRSDGWTNGSPFNCGWKADHCSFQNGLMVLTLDNQPSSGKPYTSDEYRSNAFYGYGTLEASIKAATNDGIVGGSMFFYTGPGDGNPHDEIDIEFIKGNLSTTYFTNGVGGPETMIQLGFDPSIAFHSYKIEWHPDTISWYVDGTKVRSAANSQGALPSTPGRIMANLWPGDSTENNWLGVLKYTSPIQVQYDWIRYTPYSRPAVKYSPVKKGASDAPMNYPDPFRSEVKIEYRIEKDCNVLMNIFNMSGKMIRTIEPGVRTSGAHEESWDGNNNGGESVPAGQYFISFQAGSKKFPIMKSTKIR